MWDFMLDWLCSLLLVLRSDIQFKFRLYFSVWKVWKISKMKDSKGLTFCRFMQFNYKSNNDFAPIWYKFCHKLLIWQQLLLLQCYRDLCKAPVRVAAHHRPWPSTNYLDFTRRKINKVDVKWKKCQRDVKYKRVWFNWPTCSSFALKGALKKLVLRRRAGRMLSFSPEVFPIGWTLIQERIFFAWPPSEPNCDQKSVILCSGKFPVASFGLIASVEVGRTKKFFFWIIVHPMGTTSGENESIPPAQVWGLIFLNSHFRA